MDNQKGTGSTPTRTEPHAPAGDIYQKITGGFGKYQLIVCFMLFLSKFFVAFHHMGIIFLAPKISFTCGSEEIEECPCPDPNYDTSIFKKTINMEWNLICERKWLTSLSQTLFQLGVLLGSVFFGMAADSYGRKYPLLLSVVLELLAGIVAAYVPEYWMFTLIRFFLGIAVGGNMVTSFVIVMEFLGSKYREVGSALYHVPFNMGHMMLPGIAYFIRDYSHLQIALSAPSAIMLTYIFLPETPCWLIAVNRTDKAIRILERIATVNKLPTSNIRTVVESYRATLSANQLKKGNILDLFRTPNIRKNIMCISLNWLTCSYCFYGVSQYVGQLSGNVFINVAASASVTLLGTLASLPLLKFFGRRTILILFNFIAAVCLIILAIMPEGLVAVLLAIIGVVSSFIVFVVVYLYSSELFPTVVRNAAVGVSSMSARAGSMLAPFVIDLRSVARWLPPLVFAILPVIACATSFLLPETKGCDLMTTIEEGENFGKAK